MCHKRRYLSKTPASRTIEEMQSAIDASGYLLEGRVTRVMANRGFFVEPNQFTPDPVQPHKSIEIDVAAGYFEWVNDETKDTVSASVLVECKNNSQPFAFFVRRQQLAAVNESRIHYGGFPSFSMDQDSHIQVPLHKLLDMKEWHHYCQAEDVATQFCTFERPSKGERPSEKFKAGPNENYTKSFSNLIAVAATDSADGYGLHLRCIQVQVCYPIVVFQGPIYRVEEDNGKAKVQLVDRLQLHHATTLNGRVVQAQIDIVTESAFPQLIEDVLDELKTLRDRINGLYPRLLNSAIDQKRVKLQKATTKTLTH